MSNVACAIARFRRVRTPDREAYSRMQGSSNSRMLLYRRIYCSMSSSPASSSSLAGRSLRIANARAASRGRRQMRDFPSNEAGPLSTTEDKKKGTRTAKKKENRNSFRLLPYIFFEWPPIYCVLLSKGPLKKKDGRSSMLTAVRLSFLFFSFSQRGFRPMSTSNKDPTPNLVFSSVPIAEVSAVAHTLLTKLSLSCWWDIASPTTWFIR
jgi:hypothetical protein